MIQQVFIALMVIVLVILVYEFVHSIWTVDTCITYYQIYGNYSFVIPLTNKKASTWDCYHQSLNDMILYVIGIVTISLFLGMAIKSGN